MNKILKGSLLSLISILTLTSINVKAKEVYYTNLNGVEMSEQEYNNIVTIFSEQKATSISQDMFNAYKNATILENEVSYQKEVYNDFGIIYTGEVSREEYENEYSKKDTTQTRSSDSGYFETSYKRLSVSLVDTGSYRLVASLSWKKVPACRSYDVFAFRTTHMSYSNVLGEQTYYTSSGYTDIDYNSSSAGYKSLSNGAGFSMNLKDGSNITKYEMALTANLAISEWNYSTAHVFVSYQHAQSDLSRANSMSYTLQAGGLGNVVYYSNTTIRNKYDGMTGIELRTYI